MRKPAYQNIAVMTELASVSGRDELSGVLKYINSGRQWSPQILNTVADLPRLCTGRRRPDGVILGCKFGVLDRLMELDIPTVAIEMFQKWRGALPPHVSFVTLDDESIGAAAARHFRSRAAFNSFAFVASEFRSHYVTARERGFRAAIAAAGHDVRVFDLEADADDSRPHGRLLDGLRLLPKPLAVMAASDHTALSVFEACKRLGLDIPGQVAILGVDNEELFCTTVNPSLTSIHPNHIGLGFRAAQELDRLLRGKSGVSIILPDSVKDLVLRDSTRVIPPAGRLVQTALSFIEANAARNLRVGDVVQHLGVSRRLADLRFRQIQHESILQAISRARIGLVKKRLLATRDPLVKIAKDCSFRSSAALARFFLREVGMTMTSWRSKS